MRLNKTTIFCVAITGMWLAYSLFMMGMILEPTPENHRCESNFEQLQTDSGQNSNLEYLIAKTDKLDHTLKKQAERSEIGRLELELESTKILAHHLAKDWQQYILSQQYNCDWHATQIKKLEGRKATEAIDECLTDRRATYMDKQSFDVLVFDEIDHFEGQLEMAIQEGWTVREVHGQLAESVDDIQEVMRNYDRQIQASR